LATRSATGRLFGESLSDVEAAANASYAAVSAVLCSRLPSSNPSAPSSNMLGNTVSQVTSSKSNALDSSSQRHSSGSRPASRQISALNGVGNDSGLRRDACNASGSSTAEDRSCSSRSKGSRDGVSSNSYEAEATATRKLLVASVLLWPWPEFHEVEAMANTASNSDAADCKSSDNSHINPERLNMQAVGEEAVPRIAQHAARLKKTWPLWGRPLPASDAPGGGLVLRECLLLCFLHAATAFVHFRCAHTCGEWVLPLLREGLALAIVLFGPNHALAIRLINTYQKAVQTKQSPHDSPAVDIAPVLKGHGGVRSSDQSRSGSLGTSKLINGTSGRVEALSKQGMHAQPLAPLKACMVSEKPKRPLSHASAGSLGPSPGAKRDDQGPTPPIRGKCDARRPQSGSIVKCRPGSSLAGRQPCPLPESGDDAHVQYFFQSLDKSACQSHVADSRAVSAGRSRPALVRGTGTRRPASASECSRTSLLPYARIGGPCKPRSMPATPRARGEDDKPNSQHDTVTGLRSGLHGRAFEPVLGSRRSPFDINSCASTTLESTQLTSPAEDGSTVVGADSTNPCETSTTVASGTIPD